MRRLLLIVLACCGGKSENKPPEPVRDDAAVAPPIDALVLPPAPPLPTPPASLPRPVLPETVTPETAALGELLFWDPRLSANGKLACASCHDPAHGYASGKLMETAEGQIYVRRAPTLVNLAWDKELGWDGRYASMAEHLAAHMPGQLASDLAGAVARIANVPGYRAHFARVGGDPTPKLATIALEAFVLTRYDGDAPWDKHERAADVPPELKAGYQLFVNKTQCSLCHTPPLYTDLRYHRLGLIDARDEGRGRVDPDQKGAFKTPTLRGAAGRLGFFHDASAPTLAAAVDWHLAGGTGQGADRSIIDPLLKKVMLSPQERANLDAFLRALTDPKLAKVRRPVLP